VQKWIEGGMTVSKCLAVCAGGGYAVAGVESGVECFCGISIPGAGAKAANGDFNMPCSGAAVEVCGAEIGSMSLVRKVCRLETAVRSTQLPSFL